MFPTPKASESGQGHEKLLFLEVYCQYIWAAKKKKKAAKLVFLFRALNRGVDLDAEDY